MRLITIGEAMIELAPAGGDDPALYRAGHAGDSLNTAWYLRRLCPPDWQVDFLTRLGRDAQSARLAAFVQGAGIGLPPVPPHPDRIPGLYLITLDRGERSFTYWRDRSAARTLMEAREAVGAALASADLAYVTGITLAILPPEDRAALLSDLAAAGLRIAFDPNHRPRLWPDPAAAREAYMRAAAVSALVLPSFEDEAALFGDADPMATAARYGAAGAAEVVVKNGAGAGALWHGGRAEPLPAPEPVTPVDTTGAGDSFNAGYLSARLAGASPDEALARAQGVARQVVQARGALVDIAPP